MSLSWKIFTSQCDFCKVIKPTSKKEIMMHATEILRHDMHCICINEFN